MMPKNLKLISKPLAPRFHLSDLFELNQIFVFRFIKSVPLEFIPWNTQKIENLIYNLKPILSS